MMTARCGWRCGARWGLFGLVAVMSAAWAEEPPADRPRPNILWLTSEDNGPHLGCYGDAFATTPNLDRLAQKGLCYRLCWSNAPVCAPARTAIITGMYPTSLGAEHMRSLVRLPPGVRLFPQLLREAGYYCTNCRKEDYNVIKPGQVWDESSRKAHWKNRPKGRPFFAVFNSTKSHESQIRRRPHKLMHDPAKVRVPAYHPDRPEVRADWAQYYDKITEMDAELGQRLRELEQAGLADETIVFYFGDHGSGMPRSKRVPYNSGLQVPLIVYIPPRFAHLRPDDWKAGGMSDRLVSFVDLAPTVLSLCGIRPPAWMQGQAWLGPWAAPPRKYVFGFRGRMDERYDLMRTVTDGRYVYVRNFHPHLPLGQYIAYMFRTPTTRIWHELYEAGKLNAVQAAFWEPKPFEALFDLATDPDETRNLASDPAYRQVRDRMRAALWQWLRQVQDVGFIPEAMLLARCQGTSPYRWIRQNGAGLADEREQEPRSEERNPRRGATPAGRVPYARILEAADVATDPSRRTRARLVAMWRSPEPAVRWWGLVGLEAAGPQMVRACGDAWRRLLEDADPSVRVAAARVAVRYGEAATRRRAFEVLLDASDVSKRPWFLAVAALGAIDAAEALPEDVRRRLEPLPRRADVPRRVGHYVGNLLDHLLARPAVSRRAPMR